MAIGSDVELNRRSLAHSDTISQWMWFDMSLVERQIAAMVQRFPMTPMTENRVNMRMTVVTQGSGYGNGLSLERDD
jgi:hypothetical protein